MPRVAAAAAASPLRKMARTATAAEGDLADAGWDNAALAAAMEEAEETSDGAATTAQQPPPEAASGAGEAVPKRRHEKRVAALPWVARR
eukprot:SAG25_NODE_13431_length_267_cov_0.619048_1_plen_88_part_11